MLRAFPSCVFSINDMLTEPNRLFGRCVALTNMEIAISSNRADVAFDARP